MPGFYGPGEYDVAGFAVGAVRQADVIDGSTIAEGDVLLGLPSSGLHSNGFSLARKIAQVRAPGCATFPPEQGAPMPAGPWLAATAPPGSPSWTLPSRRLASLDLSAATACAEVWPAADGARAGRISRWRLFGGGAAGAHHHLRAAAAAAAAGCPRQGATQAAPVCTLALAVLSRPAGG